MMKIRVNIYSTLSCAGFSLSSTRDSYWELSALECGLFFFFSSGLWFILLVFTDLHSPIPIVGMHSHPSLLMLGSALWDSSANGMWVNTHTSSQVEGILSLSPCGCLVSLSPSLCHENENVLDQGRSLSLNLRKSRPHSLALTCSLELQQLFSTFMWY